MKRRIAALAPLSTNMAERKHSPYYVPAPWGDKERGELIEQGHSPSRAKRWARKNARRLTHALSVALLTLALTLGFGHALAPGYHTAGELEWCEHCP